MSHRSDDGLIDHVAESDGWSALVEAHLDAHPLPVDEGSVEESASRLMARIRAAERPPRSRRGWWLAGGLLAAAAVAVIRAAPEPVAHVVEPERTAILRIEAPPAQPRDITVETELVQLGPGSVVLSAEVDHASVLFVQEGEARVGDETVEAGHWALVGQAPDGTPRHVVYPDGQAPPELHPDVWPAAQVEAALREVRWESLPGRTLETLDDLLEEEP